VTNITFIFETSPNTNPKEKKVGRDMAYYTPRLKKWGGHVLRVPHHIAPMTGLYFYRLEKKIFADESHFLVNGYTSDLSG